MKKFCAILAVFGLIFSICLLTREHIARENQNLDEFYEHEMMLERQPETRTATAYIFEMDSHNDTITLKDTNGNLWDLIEMDTTNYQIGQKVNVIFKTCKTPEITDDIIISFQ